VVPTESGRSASPAGAAGTGTQVDASGAVESPTELRDPGRVFAALADPRRRELLELLAGTPGASAGVLAARLPVSRQAVAQHLAVLEECALVTRRRAGRQVLFSVRPEGLQATADWLLARTAAWLGR
jgi:DNA-binding transcriptional ArsR family regulator